MIDAEMAADLQVLQAEEEEAATLRKRWIVAWRHRRGPSSMVFGRCSSRSSRLLLFLRRCKEKEEEGVVKTSKSKTKPVSSWCCQRQARAVRALQRAVWSLIFLVFGVHSVTAEEQGSQVQQRMSEKDLLSNSPSRLPMVEKRPLEACDGERVAGTFCKKKRRNSQGRDSNTPERNSQGKDPRTSDENSQGGDFSITGGNSQGKDLRTFAENRSQNL